MTNTNLHVTRRKHAAVESCYVTAVHDLLGDAWPACHELLDVLQFKEAAVKAVILLRDLGQLAYEAKCEVQAQREISTALLLRSSYLWPQERKAAVAVDSSLAERVTLTVRQRTGRGRSRSVRFSLLVRTLSRAG